MPETPEPAKARTEETAANSESYKMLTDFILRLAERVTLLEREVLELRQHAHIGEFTEDQDTEE